jgi:hydrogenase maturation factor HypF (carbamoyltransferase family)
MSVALVVDQVSQPVSVIATVTYSMNVAFVVEQVSQQAIVIATETCSMSVEYVMDQELFTIVDVQTFLKEIVTVMET